MSSGERHERARQTQLSGILDALDPSLKPPTEGEMRVLAWLSGWEPEITDVVEGLLRRNRAASFRAGYEAAQTQRSEKGHE